MGSDLTGPILIGAAWVMMGLIAGFLLTATAIGAVSFWMFG
jgi:hypothetical protein